jgi:murein DD-endopeptidase MepM/ murein hydrolase activator NlpD
MDAFCQDGPVVSLRTLSILTVTAFSLAACGTPGDTPTTSATPQFVEPSLTAPAEPTPSPGATTAEKAPAGGVTSSATPKKTASKPAPASAPSGIKYVFPVKASNVAFHPTHSKYPATDIFADCGQPAVATTSGVVLEVSLKDQYVKGAPDGPKNGGLSVSILGDDGVRYYGSHLSKVQSGIKAGVRVKAGQQVGQVGRTGNANNVCHLHFGISPACAKTGDWKVRRGVIWPAPYLKSWRAGGKKSPVATVAKWKKSHNCKA